MVSYLNSLINCIMSRNCCLSIMDWSSFFRGEGGRSNGDGAWLLLGKGVSQQYVGMYKSFDEGMCGRVFECSCMGWKDIHADSTLCNLEGMITKTTWRYQHQVVSLRVQILSKQVLVLYVFSCQYSMIIMYFEEYDTAVWFSERSG